MSSIGCHIKLRLCDKHTAELNRQARQVNVVWNYCNEMQQKAVRSGRQWLTSGSLQKLTSGSSTLLDLHAHTITRVCRQYDISRMQHRKPWLRWRSHRRSLGWVPFNTGHVTVIGPRRFKFRGLIYETMHWRDIPVNSRMRAGSFNQDAQGHWYINCLIDFPLGWFAQTTHASVVGVDLGLKVVATLSTGEKITNPKHFNRLAERYGKAQRAHKKRQAAKLSAKIAHCRKDHLHKISARIALDHDHICVGNVPSKPLARTRLAKSMLDAGWSTLRTQLSYKALRHGGRYIEVDEHMTTQTCSSCGSKDAPERPQGIAGLGIREWTCGGCGATHDRDVNAARNILARGLASLVEGAAH